MGLSNRALRSLAATVTLIFGCGVQDAAVPAERADTPAAPPAGEAAADMSRGAASGIFAYHMAGNLDSAQLQCDGRANIVETAETDTSRTWTWQLEDVTCSGDGEVDWLHEGESRGEVVERNGSWVIPKVLPGRAFCMPEGRLDSAEHLVRLDIACTWQCASPEYPCAGQATYTFERIP